MTRQLHIMTDPMTLRFLRGQMEYMRREGLVVTRSVRLPLSHAGGATGQGALNCGLPCWVYLGAGHLFVLAFSYRCSNRDRAGGLATTGAVAAVDVLQLLHAR